MPPVIVPDRFAVAILTTPTHEIALQRRLNNGKIYAGMLGLFGGLAEFLGTEFESPRQTINRELLEELGVTPVQTALRELEDIPFDPVAEYPRSIIAHVFYGQLPDGCEAQGDNGSIECYTPRAALVQPDLMPSARAGIERYGS